MNLRALLPQKADLETLPGSWKGDVVAGLTVGIVALPLALAFGVSSGVGAAAGLVTAIVAGFVAAVFGGSHIQVSGPTGAMAVVLAPIVATYGASSVALVAVMAGVILCGAALFGLGRAINFIPWPVIEGFTTGIAIIIFLQQVPAALDVPAEVGSNAATAAWTSLRAAWESPAASTGWALGAVGAVAAIMVVSRRIHPAVPGSLVAIVVVSTLAEVFDAPLARIGALPDTLPAPAVPTASLDSLNTLIGAALTVAALAGIESLLSVKVASTMSDTGVPQPDRELVGQGLASIASGFFGGMPATGAIARTAVNINAGARSRLAALVHAALLLTVVYLLAPAVSRIPLAALSGVLVVVAIRMIDVEAARSIAASTKSGSLTYVVTTGVTVAFDLIEAVEIGVVIAAFFALRAVAMTSGAHREQIPGVAMPGDERIALFRLNGSVFFGAADRVLEDVHAIDGIDVVIVRMSQVTLLDATGARKLSELVTTLERRGVTVLIKGIQDKHMKLAATTGVIGSLRHANHLFNELEPAIAHARSHVNRAAGRVHLPSQFSRPETMPPATH